MIARLTLLTGLAGALLCAAGLHAQALRDPTQAPVAVRDGDANPTADAGGPVAGAMSVIRRDGRPHLVVGTRLYAQGQMVGPARIERISETELWLREGGVLRKLPMFAGVQRSPARVPVPACTGAKPGRAKPTKPTEAPSGAPLAITCDPAKP